jgi:hypothetical protein
MPFAIKRLVNVVITCLWLSIHVFSLALPVTELKIGTATATRIAIITTTIISSTSEKPFLLFKKRNI